MEAKLILEQQKIASASSQLATSNNQNTQDLIGAAFSTGLFNHGPANTFSNNNENLTAQTNE